MSRSFDTPCTIEVEHGFDHLHAHVELDGDVPIYPGDKVRVHGSAIKLPYGERLVEHRMATVTRATALERAWTKFRARFEITELYELSFSNGKSL
jgi:TPP-dependent indolepyruvate ferredoxin oxidoreductase alpha subunit